MNSDETVLIGCFLFPTDGNGPSAARNSTRVLKEKFEWMNGIDDEMRSLGCGKY